MDQFQPFIMKYWLKLEKNNYYLRLTTRWNVELIRCRVLNRDRVLCIGKLNYSFGMAFFFTYFLVTISIATIKFLNLAIIKSNQQTIHMRPIYTKGSFVNYVDNQGRISQIIPNLNVTKYYLARVIPNLVIQKTPIKPNSMMYLKALRGFGFLGFFE